jgi:hypothetical protein
MSQLFDHFLRVTFTHHIFSLGASCGIQTLVLRIMSQLIDLFMSVTSTHHILSPGASGGVSNMAQRHVGLSDVAL